MRRRALGSAARRFVRVALGLFLFVLPSGTALAKDVRPARFCAACHGQVRRDWEASSMGKSWKNPVFQAFLADAKAALGDTILSSCIACHAPIASVTGDKKFESPVSQEGVTCNFCHNVSAVDLLSKPPSYTFDASDPELMRGPYADSDAGKAHGFVFSEIHTKSEFCASCHEHADPASGVAIETTYSRWKSSREASGGKQCQDCHMPAKPGKAAATSKIKREAVHAHTFHGAHNAAMLDSAATLGAAVEGGRLKLSVQNRAAGHALPGGGGGMRVISLGVAFLGAAKETLSTATVQTYGIQYADGTGKTPVPKWLAKTIVSRREIPPDSTVVEWCDIPANAKRAEAVLTYHFIEPAYVAGLKQRQVDLSAHQPAVMARAGTTLP